MPIQCSREEPRASNQPAKFGPFIFDFDACVDWLQEQLQLTFTAPIIAYGIADKRRAGRIVAGVVFTDFTGSNVHINLAGRQALSRPALRVNAEIAFNTLHCRRLSALTKVGTRMHDMMYRLGFEYEGRIRQYYPGGEDAIMWGMLREECRWF